MDSACCFDRLLKAKKYVVEEDPVHTCFLKSVAVHEGINDREFEDLLRLGCPIRNRDDVTVFRISMIFGQTF